MGDCSKPATRDTRPKPKACDSGAINVLWKNTFMTSCALAKLETHWVSSVTGIFLFAVSLKGLWTVWKGKRYMVLVETVLIAITFVLLILCITSLVYPMMKNAAKWVSCSELTIDELQTWNNMGFKYCLPDTVPDTISSVFRQYAVFCIGVTAGFISVLCHLYATAATFEFGRLLNNSDTSQAPNAVRALPEIK